MASFSKQKDGIFGGIAALKTLTENANKKDKSIQSGATNIIDSLLEIYKQLGGYKEMVETIENILVKNLDSIEQTVKSTIKTSLKQIISCGIEPTIDTSMTVDGVTFTIKNIDPLSILQIDPTSENGQLAYFDNDKGINSKDFNVFLYSAISNSMANPSTTGYTWSDADGSPLLSLKFVENNNITNETNTITIKIDGSYLGKKLSSFISDYLDSVKLFNNVQVLSSIFDDIMGSKIFSVKKTKDQLASEKMIDKLCSDILNNVDEGDVIDDSFYQFSNDTYNTILQEAESKKKGVFNYSGDNEFEVAIDESLLTSSLLELKNVDSSKVSQQTKIITDAIDNITNDIVKKSNVNEKDKFALNLDFIQKIISKLMTTLTMFIFSPKIIYLFVMTTKLLGLDTPSGIVDFIKKNINIFKLIIIKIRDIITTELTKKIIEMLNPLISQTITIIAKEQMVIYKKQLDGIKALVEASLALLGF